MGRFLTYVAIGVVLTLLLMRQYGPLGGQSQEYVPQPPVVQHTVDRSEAGNAFDDLFGGSAPAQEIPRQTIPYRPAPRSDTPIYGGS